MTQLIDSTTRLVGDFGEDMRLDGGIVTEQHIPDEFLKAVSDKRTAQDASFAQDDLHLCSIPTAVIDHWHRNGFNITDKNVTPQDIVARLQAESLTAFLCTTKTV